MAQGKRGTRTTTGPRSTGTGAKRESAADKAAREAAVAARDRRRKSMDSKMHVDGEAYTLGDLTLGELGELEDHVNLPMDAISFGSAKVIAFVVYLVRRRDDPNYTLDDAGNIQIRHVEADDVDDPSVVAAVGDRPTGAG